MKPLLTALIFQFIVTALIHRRREEKRRRLASQSRHRWSKFLRRSDDTSLWRCTNSTVEKRSDDHFRRNHDVGGRNVDDNSTTIRRHGRFPPFDGVSVSLLNIMPVTDITCSR
uniref:Secreted protein n=1 Tax=Angiostrongylus cantonensis TaxID=6313 RepID=A0A0K0D7A2_ANGCA